MEPGLALLLRLVAAIGVSAALSLMVGRWVLRLDRRGAGVVGGVCAGLALGPAVLGGLAPGLHADWMVGGVRQAAEAARIEARLPGEVASLRGSGVSEVAVREHEATERSRAEALRREAERDRASRRSMAAAMAGSCALLAGMLLARPMRVRWAAAGSGWLTGVLSLLVGAVGARLALGVGMEQAVVFGAVLASGSVAWRGTGAARSFGLGALAVSAVGLSVWAGLWTGVALTALIGLGVVIRALDDDASGGRLARGVAQAVLVPTSAALVVSLAGRDVSVGGAVLIGVACLLSSDARFVGAWIAANVCESGAARARPMSTWVARFGRAGAGWQLLLLGLAVAGSGIAPESAAGAAMVYAIAGAAVTTEVTRPAVMRALRRFRREVPG